MQSCNYDFRLDGRRALVTGASRGIGRAIALALAEAGADVAITSRDVDALHVLAKDVNALGRRALVLPCDVTDPAQITACAEQAIAELGPLDVLVNNAGVLPSVGPFLELPAADWDTVTSTNLDSAVHFCRQVGPHMLDRGSGSVINVSSIAGLRGVPAASHYAASKAALVSLSQTLAAEWADRGVRVNALCPGFVRTKMTALLTGDEEFSNTLMAAVPARRWGEATDVTGGAVFLAGDASRFLTGQALVVDGGLTAYEGGPSTLGLTRLGHIENRA